jgi:hypothetical protein
MLQRITSSIFTNALDGDFPKCNLHIHYNGEKIKIKKNDKKIKIDLVNINQHFNNIVQKTFKNFIHYIADKDPKKDNLMFTKKGTFLEWGIIDNGRAVIFFQRYSKGDLQAILSAKIIGEADFVRTARLYFVRGIEKYKKEFRDFKKKNSQLYANLRNKRNTLKNFRKQHHKHLKITKNQQFINIEKTLKLEVFELMSEISAKNPSDIGFLNETNYFKLSNFTEEEINQIIGTSKFSNYSSYMFESNFLLVKINDLDYKKELMMQSIHKESPRVLDKNSKVYKSLVLHFKEIRELRDERERFERSFYGIIKEEIEPIDFFEEGILLQQVDYFPSLHEKYMNSFF